MAQSRIQPHSQIQNMDYHQSKLTKNEWISIEKAVDHKEKTILEMIKKGFTDPDYKIHTHYVISELIKLDHPEKDYYIYIHILKELMDKLIKTYKLPIIEAVVPKKKMNNADTIRIQSYRKKQMTNIEFILLDMIEKFFKEKDSLHFYNICMLYKKYTINKYVFQWIDTFVANYDSMDIAKFLENTNKYIENNPIFDYKPIGLYDHQKQIYKCVESDEPKLIFYRAPTSSGKTLTPIGLCEKYKVIFICASRHIAINLAKSGVNIGRKVGFAFGCNTIDDVRLHYFSVKSYITEKGRKRPDHSDGSNIEMLFCDIPSYEIAMLYMLSFFKKENILLFWDEPTISMNYETHPLHSDISKLWKINQIPNIILSSATLPNLEDLDGLIQKFRATYNQCGVHYIQTQDENTNITLLDTNGNVIMPHSIFSYDDFKQFVEKHAYSHSKYLSITECANFILYLSQLSEVFKTIVEEFGSIRNINNQSIRDMYYKACIKIKPDQWTQVIAGYKRARFQIGLGDEITTKYSHTLTYGPTIYLCEDIDKWMNYFVENSGIHASVFKELEANIDFNNDVLNTIGRKRKTLEDRTMKDESNENKMKDQRFDPITKQLIEDIDALEGTLKEIQLNPLYIPNTKPHFEKWTNYKYQGSNVFTSDVGETFVRKIMNLTIDKHYKILLLMGIGVFDPSIKNDDYNDIMKELADEKKLLVIIAGKEYINGTNYQFYHAYLADDIVNINQETIIQAIGRVGRKEKNKTFTFRFRDNSVIQSLFVQKNRIEMDNLNRLFF